MEELPLVRFPERLRSWAYLSNQHRSYTLQGVGGREENQDQGVSAMIPLKRLLETCGCASGHFTCIYLTTLNNQTGALIPERQY